jgi:hypothetical protein
LKQENRIDPITDETEFESLLNEGIAMLQKLSGEVWTDYNEHDPGVTILENLCYSFTDIINRIKLPVGQLIANEKGGISARSQAMYTARDIFSVNPTTDTDFRKFIIDLNEKIINVWIKPCTASIKAPGNGELKLNINGVRSILIDLDTDNNSNGDDIKKQVFNALISSRNFGEHYPLSAIKIANILKCVVSFTIIIQDTVHAEEIIAEILYKIKSYLRPEIKRYSYQELSDNGYTTEQIFDGPKLNNGFILNEDLKDQVLTINSDELLKQISAIEGIKGIEKIVFMNQSNSTVEDYDDDTVLELEILDSLDQIQVFKNQKQYTINKSLIRSELNNLISKNKRIFSAKFQKDQLDIVPEKEEYIKYDTYYSMQKDFPRIYGIGTDGVAATSSTSRKVKALQLKAYLLFFEQVLADTLSQLKNLKNLFSINEQVRSYFFQPVYNVPNVANLLKGFELSPEAYYNRNEGQRYIEATKSFINNTNNKYIEELTRSYSIIDMFLTRRDMFLDHLLSRFNFSDKDFPLFLTEPLTDDALAKRIKYKEAFLKNMVNITGNRGKAQWDNHLVPGFATYLREKYLHDISGIDYRIPQLAINDQLELFQLVSEPDQENDFWLKMDGNKAVVNISCFMFNEIITAAINTSDFNIEYSADNINVDVKVYGLTQTLGKWNRHDKYATKESFIERLISELLLIYFQIENIFVIDNILLLPELAEEKFRVGTSKTQLLPVRSFASLKNLVLPATYQPSDTLSLYVDYNNELIHQDYFSGSISFVFRESDVEQKEHPDVIGSVYLDNILSGNIPAHLRVDLYYLTDTTFSEFVELYIDLIREKTGSKEGLIKFLIRNSKSGQTTYSLNA